MNYYLLRASYCYCLNLSYLLALRAYRSAYYGSVAVGAILLEGRVKGFSYVLFLIPVKPKLSLLFSCSFNLLRSMDTLGS